MSSSHRLIRHVIQANPLKDDIQDLTANLAVLDRLRPPISIEEDKYLLEFIRHFVAKHGHVPSRQTIRQNFERSKENEIVDRLTVIGHDKHPALTGGDFVALVEEVIDAEMKEKMVAVLKDTALVLDGQELALGEGRDKTFYRGWRHIIGYLTGRLEPLVALRTPSDESTWLTLDQVEEQPVEWLWPGRIPAGELSLIEGPGAAGKSSIMRAVAAFVTTGRALPGAEPRPPGRVVWLSSEEDPARVLKPRLRAVGADLARVIIRKADALHWTSAATVELKKLVGKEDLVVIDALKDHLPGLGRGGDWAEAEVRAALRPLVDLAHETGCAVVGVRHWRKGVGAASERGAGSVAYRNVARATLVVGQRDDQSYLAVEKCSLGEPATTLKFRIFSTSEGLPSLAWEGGSDVTADDLSTAAKPNAEERDALSEAVSFLEAVLGNGPLPSKEVLRQAKEAGVAERTLSRARKALGVEAKPVGKEWVMCLPGQEAVDLSGCESLGPSSPDDIDTLLDSLDVPAGPAGVH